MTKASITLVNTQLNAGASLFNSGYIRIYTGAQPATPETVLDGQRFLVELRFGSPAFSAASDRAIVANPITPGVAVASGLASWCRVLSSDGVTVLGDTTKIALNSTDIQVGAKVSILGFIDMIAMER